MAHNTLDLNSSKFGNNVGNGQLGQSYEFPNVSQHRQLQGSQLREQQQNQRKMSIERRKINNSPGLVVASNSNQMQ